MKVGKAVITAAGWGTRFLPITKSQPKEMLPLVNKPLIQHSVEEAASSGIEQVIVITAPGKRAIKDYFARSPELESALEQRGETELLNEMHELARLVDICYVTQEEPLGLGHAILMARDVVGNEPFAVLLPDDIVDSRVPVLKQMLAVFEQYQDSVLAVEPVNKQDTIKYGIIVPRMVSERIYQVLGLVEKPEPEEAPSNLAIVGRYILMPQIFDAIEVTPPGKKGEIQLTDALEILLKQQDIYACEFNGVRYDTGTPLGWLECQVAFALKHPDLGPELREYLRHLL